MKFFSKAQFNMFSEVAAGTRKVLGLTRTQAVQDIKGKNSKGLPKKAKKSKKYKSK